MRRAVTLVELLIIIAIIAIIFAIAAPNLAERNKAKVGEMATVRATGQRVKVIATDTRTSPITYLCRIDNGPQANPRFTEARFTLDELERVAPEAVEKE